MTPTHFETDRYDWVSPLVASGIVFCLPTNLMSSGMMLSARSGSGEMSPPKKDRTASSGTPVSSGDRVTAYTFGRISDSIVALDAGWTRRMRTRTSSARGRLCRSVSTMNGCSSRIRLDATESGTALPSLARKEREQS